MGAKPSSAVQQSAYLEALDKYIDTDEEGERRLDNNGNPQRFRDRFALYCDDVACGSNSLEELERMFVALVSCFKRAGIQVKASKVNLESGRLPFTTTPSPPKAPSQKRPTSAPSEIWEYPSTCTRLRPS